MLILTDLQQIHQALLPISALKSVADLRVGICKIQEKWAQISQQSVYICTAPYLQPLYERAHTGGLYINAALCPNALLWEAIYTLKNEEALCTQEEWLAWRTDAVFANNADFEQALQQKKTRILELDTQKVSLRLIKQVWHIFQHNRAELITDFERLTKNRESAPIEDRHTIVYKPQNIFLEEGAQVKAAVLNAENGPIYLGKNSQVEEGCIVRGAAALCEGATLNTGTKLRGDSTLGPFCKVGGEISNVVFQAYSNKGHEGFLGNAVVGEWCNLGALTTGSNLKNNYSDVKVWSVVEKMPLDTGLKFCGPIIGDHAKTAIGLMLNTGTVIDVAANLIETNFRCKYFKAFLWHRGEHLTPIRWSDFEETLRVVMQRRSFKPSEAYMAALHYLHHEKLA